MGYFWTGLAALALIGGWLYRRRIGRSPVVTDDVIRSIEASGRADVDEPLDLDEAQEAEREFWEEDWDEPEEW